MRGIQYRISVLLEGLVPYGGSTFCVETESHAAIRKVLVGYLEYVGITDAAVVSVETYASAIVGKAVDEAGCVVFPTDDAAYVC